jgi:hypothetical protein
VASIVDPPPDSKTDAHDDWSDAPHRVDNVCFTHRGQHHYQVTVTTDTHRVAVSVSPQGRSVRVWLDGIPMQEESPKFAATSSGRWTVPDEEPEEIRGCARYEWERIVRRVVMPGPTKCVAFALATYANQDGTSIFPGNERLTAVTCYSDKAVRSALEWLRGGYLVERVREGSRGGRRGLADEYRLIVPSDLLTRHAMLDPDESPVPRTGDNGSHDTDHRYVRSGTPVPQAGTPVPQAAITGTTYRTPTHDHPRNQHTNQRDDSSLVTQVQTARDDEAPKNVIRGRFGAAR